MGLEAASRRTQGDALAGVCGGVNIRGEVSQGCGGITCMYKIDTLVEIEREMPQDYYLEADHRITVAYE